MKASSLGLVLIVAAFLSCGTSAAQESESGRPATFVLIVNKTNPTVSLGRSRVVGLFLKKSSEWDDGSPARPVDQAKDSLLREAFSKDILHKSVAAVNSYWQQQIFSGRAVPLPELASDEEVLAHVRLNPGAIGYVSGDANVSAVKVIGVDE